MNHFETILAAIHDDAAEQEKRILADAEEKAAALLQSAEEEAASECAAILQAAEEKAQRTRRNAESAAVGLKRKRLLAEKSRILHAEIEAFRQELEEKPDEEYFAYFARQLETYADGGEIVLSQKEAGRDAAVLRRKLKEWKEKSGREFTLSAAFDSSLPSGLLVRYGKIEENLSLEAIFQEREDRMKDRLSELLFKEAK